jgi:hypothetical protein
VSALLTPEELQALTGLRQAAAQIRWLRRAGITHYIRADGKPAVPAAALVAAEVAEPPTQPDFAALRRAG